MTHGDQVSNQPVSAEDLRAIAVSLRAVHLSVFADSVDQSANRIEALEGALRELVRLKDLHDSIERYQKCPGVRKSDAVAPRLAYEKAKPLAWDAARKVLEVHKDG